MTRFLDEEGYKTIVALVDVYHQNFKKMLFNSPIGYVDGFNIFIKNVEELKEGDLHYKIQSACFNLYYFRKETALKLSAATQDELKTYLSLMTRAVEAIDKATKLTMSELEPELALKCARNRVITYDRDYLLAFRDSMNDERWIIEQLVNTNLPSGNEREKAYNAIQEKMILKLDASGGLKNLLYAIVNNFEADAIREAEANARKLAEKAGLDDIEERVVKVRAKAKSLLDNVSEAVRMEKKEPAPNTDPATVRRMSRELEVA